MAIKKKHASFFGGRPSAAEFYGIQQDMADLEPQLDKLSVRHQSTTHTDSSSALTTVPNDYPEAVDFEVASEPPTVDFAIVQGLQPWYLPVDDQIHVSPLNTSGGFAMWSGFGAIRRGPDHSYYYSIGNHMYYGGNAYMMKYDPVAKEQSVCFDLKTVTGWQEDSWTDGKIHGNPDIDDAGDMFVTSFSGPRPLAADFSDISYAGGHIIRHNVISGETEDLGVPLGGDTWAYSAYNGKMGVLIAVGQAKGMVMVYDTRNRELIYGGYPPPDIKWWMRCLLIDEETDRIYSSNTATRAERAPIISWSRRYNTFAELPIQSPKNPATGKCEPMRAHTQRRNPDGSYWCLDEFGFIFKFWPDTATVEAIGLNWGAAGKYTANVVSSPGGRYLYYLPGAHDRMHEYGTPVVQFDTRTRKKKVIAFLNDFYLDRYGYSPYGAYGIEIDAVGESLFFYTNGVFTTRERGSGYGRPAVFTVHVPESERIE